MSFKQAPFPKTTAEYNEALGTVLHRVRYMNIKRWKILKSLILSLSVLIFAGYAIMNGADPTTIALPALIMAGLIAGVEWSEFIAVWVETRSNMKDEDK